MIFPVGFLGGASGERICLPKQETQESDLGSILGLEDPLEEGMATRSRILAWRIPQTEEPGGHSPRGRTESDTTEATWLEHVIPHNCSLGRKSQIMILEECQPLGCIETIQKTLRRRTDISRIRLQMHLKTLEQDTMVLPTTSSTCLCLWENVSQRISLIREVRKCRDKGKQFNKIR